MQPRTTRSGRVVRRKQTIPFGLQYTRRLLTTHLLMPQENKLSGRTLRKLPVKAKIAKPRLGGRAARVRGSGAGVNGVGGGRGRGELVEWVRGMREAVEMMVEEGRRIQRPEGFEYGEAE